MRRSPSPALRESVVERSEAGEGLAAVIHKIDLFSLHTAAREGGRKSRGEAGIAGTG